MTEVLAGIGVGGMGEAIARRLGIGRQLVLADFDETALERVASALTDDGYQVQPHPVDVSRRDSVASLARHAASFGPLTGVAHTAGLSPVQGRPRPSSRWTWRASHTSSTSSHRSSRRAGPRW